MNRTGVAWAMGPCVGYTRPDLTRARTAVFRRIVRLQNDAREKWKLSMITSVLPFRRTPYKVDKRLTKENVLGPRSRQGTRVGRDIQYL